MKIKRLFAYLIDIMIVGFVASALANIDVINPYINEYMESYEKFSEKLSSNNGENANEVISSDDFILQYKSTLKYSIYSTGISFVCYILYFVGFQKWNKNQTVGKKLMKLKIINKDSSDNVNVWQYLIRTFVLYNLIFGSINVCISLWLNNKLFFTMSMMVSIIGYVITYLCYAMILFRKDGKGLHDLISKTEVVEAN